MDIVKGGRGKIGKCLFAASAQVSFTYPVIAIPHHSVAVAVGAVVSAAKASVSYLGDTISFRALPETSISFK